MLVIVSVNQVTLSRPLNNGLSVKFKQFSMKQERNKPKTFSTLFAENSQDADVDAQQNVISTPYFAHIPELANGCTNQMAKILFPIIHRNETSSQDYINIPVVEQPFRDYKIVVATAPSHIKIAGPDAKPVVVYVVFPEEEPSGSQTMNVPTVYFVTKKGITRKGMKRENVEPILIIDSNRTVTGIKSKEVAKYIKFKKQLSKIIRRNDN